MHEIRQIKATGDIAGSRIALVVSRYNGFIVDRLLRGCLDTLVQAGIEKANVSLISVPGAFEIPVAVKHVAQGGNIDAIIALGAVIRGETAHFDIIAGECARGIGRVAVDTGLPVIFGVLTVDTVDQAMDRSGDEASNKGCEAANTAMEMISLFRQID